MDASERLGRTADATIDRCPSCGQWRSTTWHACLTCSTLDAAEARQFTKEMQP